MPRQAIDGQGSMSRETISIEQRFQIEISGRNFWK
jgi:hypothetical protein